VIRAIIHGALAANAVTAQAHHAINREMIMKHTCKLLCATLMTLPLVATTASTAAELDPKAVVFKLPDQIPWGPVTPAGNQQAVMFGDPSKPGLYGVMTKWLAGNHFSRPHFHPNDVTSPSCQGRGGSAADPISIRINPACRCRQARSSLTMPSRCIGIGPRTPMRFF
jgi:hypothetical protein